MPSSSCRPLRPAHTLPDQAQGPRPPGACPAALPARPPTAHGPGAGTWCRSRVHEPRPLQRGQQGERVLGTSPAQPGREAPSRLYLCGAYKAFAGKFFCSWRLRKPQPPPGPWQRPGPGPAARDLACARQQPPTVLWLPSSPKSLHLHSMNPNSHRSCSFRIPKARGPACVGLRRLRARASISHRPWSELSTGDLQRGTQKVTPLPPPEARRPSGTAGPGAGRVQRDRSSPGARGSSPSAVPCPRAVLSGS